MRRLGTAGCVLLLWLGFAAGAAAQQIVLDSPVRAAGLIFFPAVGDPNTFYYVPQRARLATHPNGLPQFSFLRYVQNVNAEKDTSEGEGGGILHAVVQLGVTDEELGNARGELARVRPGAKIAGPAIFRSGKFGLISSFKDESGELTRQVVGLGAAPVLDGGRAAVSMRLTKLGAKILWQSFQTATPDISFQFEMELAGFRAPTRAVLEADFERIYEHRNFNVAVATPTVAAEIKDTYDELRNQGAIKVEFVGENQKFSELIDFTYRKLMDIMFQPVGGTGTPTPEQLSAGNGSLLDKATKRLADARKEARDTNTALRKERRDIRTAARAEARKAADDLAKQAKELRTAADAAAKVDPATRDYEMLEILQAEARYLQVASVDALEYAASLPESGAAAEPADLADVPQDVAVPEFAALAVYELRRSKRSDKYRIDLNQSLPDKLPIVFSENVGDLRRYLDNSAVFRNVNLDDPLFTQREIHGYFEGANADDFGKLVSFVSIQMRKQHASGEETTGEARIDRKAFTGEANDFKLVYGWKGDDDRRKWLEYEYRTLWAFQDGSKVEQPWLRTTFGAFPVVPPYEKRGVSVELFDPAALVSAGVRGVTVKLIYSFGGQEKTERITLRPGKEPTAAAAEIVLPRGTNTYDYEVEFLMPGNATRSSGRKKSESPILFVDELPPA